MRPLLLAVTVLLFYVGCNVETGLAPVEIVISESSDRDFGFEGTWIPVADPDAPSISDSFEVMISAGDVYKATATDPSDNDGKLSVEFHAIEMSPEHPHAIVEFTYKYDEKNVYRRLAIAAVEEDHLYVWVINGRKIGRLLYDDNVSAVIEHSNFSSTIRCDSKQLIEFIKNHSREVIGTPRALKRKQ